MDLSSLTPEEELIAQQTLQLWRGLRHMLTQNNRDSGVAVIPINSMLALALVAGPSSFETLREFQEALLRNVDGAIKSTGEELNEDMRKN